MLAALFDALRGGVALGALALVFGVGIVVLATWAKSKKPVDSLTERVNSLLPQIQCAKCGFPGCRPYADAIVRGERIDLCPPGGQATAQALSDLLNRPLAVPAERMAQDNVAVIDEKACVGCALCIPACPVDAILGAERYAHTVLATHCTGCELCIPACPVDCIDLVKRAAHA